MSTLFLAFLLALVTAAFALQNTDPVSVQFLVWQYDTSLVLVILGSLAIGAILAVIASIGPWWKRIRHIHTLVATMEEQKARIAELERRLQEGLPFVASSEALSPPPRPASS